jgi:tetratricopeptide (TPR) repeat protein
VAKAVARSTRRRRWRSAPQFWPCNATPVHCVCGCRWRATWAAASDVDGDAAAIDALRAVESECRARDLLVASVMNARNAFEAALLRVRERFDDAAFKAVLAAPRGALTTLLGAEQEWLDEQAGDDEGNEDEARRELYVARLAAFDAALAREAPAYVALCEEKRKQAELDRAEAEENARRVAHSSNTNAPRTNKQRLAAADLQKKGGTIAFKDHDFKSAARHFLDGVQLLSGCRDMSPEVTAQVNELQLSMLLNLSMCFLKLEKWTKVIDNCTEALKLDAANGKALFRRATAYEQQGEIDKALADAKLATPKDDAAIVALIRRVETRIAKRTENEKKMYQKMFS